MRRVGVDFVPDDLFGCSIKQACCIHDWQYRTGDSEQDRRYADRIFYENMLHLIDKTGGSWFIRGMRKAKAWAYYKAVRWFGKDNFWEGKNG
jgi:hypothetical protein